MLATDGVDSFEKLDKQKGNADFDPSAYFLLDNTYDSHAQPFAKKLEVLKENYGLIATDDIGLIRLNW